MNPQIEFTKICQEILADKTKLKFQVSGGSMRPFLHTGDTVIVETVDLSTINTGDIIFCKTATGKPYIHRVIRKLNQDQEIILWTKGDAWIHADQPIGAREVLGRVMAIERNGKYQRVGNGPSKIFNLFWLGLAKTGPFFYPLAGKIKKWVTPVHLDEELLVEILCGQNKDGVFMKKLSKPGFKWEYFLQRTRQERIAPLVYRKLAALGVERSNIPAPVFKQFQDSYYHTLSRNILIFKRTAEILDSFRKKGIKVLIFKGPVLAELLYQDIGLRPITDIDMLVAPEDLAAADSILREFNYAAPFEIKDFSTLRANSYRNSLLYSNPRETLHFIHLYWHLLNLFPYNRQVLQKFRIQNIWQSAVPVCINEIPALTLSDTHQVIYLCLHAFQHAYTPGILLWEIHRFAQLRGKSLDWNLLVQESYNLGLNKYVYFGLYLAQQLFGAPVSREFLEKLKPKKLSIFERRFLAGFVKKEFYGRQVNLGLVSLGMNEKWPKRLAYLWRAIFPTKQEMVLISQQDIGKINFTDYIRRIMGERSYRFFSGLQGMKLYRRLIGIIAGKEIAIRPADLTDKGSLKSIYKTMTLPEIEQLLNDFKGNGFWLVALKRKIIAGALTVTKDEKDEQLWLIFGLETKPLFRGLGIAKGLVQEAVKRAASAGAREVGLFVNKKAIPALNLYHQAGFCESPAPYQRSADEVYLQYSCKN